MPGLLALAANQQWTVVRPMLLLNDSVLESIVDLLLREWATAQGAFLVGLWHTSFATHPTLKFLFMHKLLLVTSFKRVYQLAFALTRFLLSSWPLSPLFRFPYFLISLFPRHAGVYWVMQVRSYKDTAAVQVIMHVLYKADQCIDIADKEDGHSLLVTAARTLLRHWGDSAAMLHCPLDQHFYITKVP